MIRGMWLVAALELGGRAYTALLDAAGAVYPRIFGAPL